MGCARPLHEYNDFVIITRLAGIELLLMCSEADWRNSTVAMAPMWTRAVQGAKIGQKTNTGQTYGRGPTPVKPAHLSRLGAVFTWLNA